MLKRKIRIHGSSQDIAESNLRVPRDKQNNRIRISSKEDPRRISKSEKTSPVTSRLIKNLALEIQPQNRELQEYVKRRVDA